MIFLKHETLTYDIRKIILSSLDWDFDLPIQRRICEKTIVSVGLKVTKNT